MDLVRPQRISQQHIIGRVICDVKLYKALIRLWHMPGLDGELLDRFWPDGLVVMLGFGLHPYKKLGERVCATFTDVLQFLFESLASSGGMENWSMARRVRKSNGLTECLDATQ